MPYILLILIGTRSQNAGYLKACKKIFSYQVEAKNNLTFFKSIPKVEIKQATRCHVTCQPTPRLRTEGGIGVALAYLDTAIKAPVDCLYQLKQEQKKTV